MRRDRPRLRTPRRPGWSGPACAGGRRVRARRASYDHRRRHVHRTDPVVRREARQRVRRLDHRGRLVAEEILAHAVAQLRMFDPHEHATQHSAARRVRQQPRGGGRDWQRGAAEPRHAPRHEVARRRAQHQPAHLLRVPPPRERRDRPAHRVAHRQEGPDRERRHRGGRVVRAFLEPEAVGAEAAPCPR